jgi:hypothetical protein
MLRQKAILCVSIWFACLCGLVSVALAAQRTALVIGNSNYKAAVPLRNPGNDARDMAEALKDLGFEVICKVDAGREEMDAAVQEFYRNLNLAQAGFFYYAGHGMQIHGRNYLFPVDIQVQSSADVKHRAIETNWILAKMEDSGSKVNIVVLDACRDNPFRGLRGAGDGLAPIQCVRGSFIAYATSPGSVAQDGTGRNGIYTSHLLKNIKRPGLTVEEVFREVRKGVAESTNYEQVPWDSSSLLGAFYMAGTGPGADAAEKRRLEQEQARIDSERRELDRLKAEIERKSQQVQEKKTDLASVPQKPKPATAPMAASELARDGVYVAYANGTVLDNRTNLMWPSNDTGIAILEQNLKEYTENYHLAGYQDWRVPTVDELRTIYNPGTKNEYGYSVTKLIRVSGEWLWADAGWGSIEPFSFTLGLLASSAYRGAGGSVGWAAMSGAGSHLLPVRGGN